jgi:hypothetical protein
MDVNAVVNGSDEQSISDTLRAGTALNLKRYSQHSLPAEKWFADDGANPYWIIDTVEMKTAWHPIGV